MMQLELPASVELGGADFRIRSDFRDTLRLIEALTDPELTERSKAEVALVMFYPDYDAIPEAHLEDALRRVSWFINGGRDDEPTGKSPKLVAWEQDFPQIVAPINRVIGQDVRGMEYLHWWTFLSAYMEIGDCLFAQIVRIRDKRARGKPLDKFEKEFLRRNRDLVDFKKSYTAAEDDLVRMWTGR